MTEMVKDSGGATREARFGSSTHRLAWASFTGGFAAPEAPAPKLLGEKHTCFSGERETTSRAKPGWQTMLINAEWNDYRASDDGLRACLLRAGTPAEEEADDDFVDVWIEDSGPGGSRCDVPGKGPKKVRGETTGPANSWGVSSVDWPSESQALHAYFRGRGWPTLAHGGAPPDPAQGGVRRYERRGSLRQGVSVVHIMGLAEKNCWHYFHAGTCAEYSHALAMY
mmetsp:Transcript_14492/g.34954  ORF Transcript_14492/g.34954 Transcript_14492/m.34954 type:complete len:225 (+) Transcript_14492:3-677(+)